MMDRAMKKFDRASGKIAGDFRTMIADSEDLLKAAASVSGEGFTAARAKFEQNVARAKIALADASQPLIDKTGETAAAADDYVTDNPWTSVGVAVAVGMLIGFLAAKR